MKVQETFPHLHQKVMFHWGHAQDTPTIHRGIDITKKLSGLCLDLGFSAYKLTILSLPVQEHGISILYLVL